MRRLTDVRIATIARRTSLNCKDGRRLPLISELIVPTIDHPFLAFASADPSYCGFTEVFKISPLEFKLFPLWTLIAFGDGVKPPSTRLYDIRWPRAVYRGCEFEIPVGTRSSVTLRCTRRHGVSQSAWSISTPDNYQFILTSKFN